MSLAAPICTTLRLTCHAFQVTFAALFQRSWTDLMSNGLSCPGGQVVGHRQVEPVSGVAQNLAGQGHVAQLSGQFEQACNSCRRTAHCFHAAFSVMFSLLSFGRLTVGCWPVNGCRRARFSRIKSLRLTNKPRNRRNSTLQTLKTPILTDSS